MNQLRNRHVHNARTRKLLGTLATTAGLLIALGTSTCGTGRAASPQATLAPAPQATALTAIYHFVTTVPIAPVGTKFVDVWIPLPSDGPYQSIVGVSVLATVPYQFTREPKFGNRMVYVHVPSNQTPTTIDVSFVGQRRPAQILTLPPDGTQPTLPGKAATATLPSAKLSLQRDVLVPVGGRYTAMAKTIAGARTTPRSQMRALFDNIVSTMQYDYKHESPEIGQGDAAFICSYKKGNCTDLHSSLTTYARSLGIPTYIEFGYPIAATVPAPDPLPTEGSIEGYHCWVWFQDPEIGWLPVDAADARRSLDAKRPDLEDFLFGDLVTERSSLAVSRGRDLTLEPPQQGDPLNYFIRAYAEADGTPLKIGWTVRYALPQRNPTSRMSKPSDEGKH